MSLFTYYKSIGFVIGISLFLYLLDPYMQGFWFGYFLAFLMVANKNWLQNFFDRGFILLLLFSLTYALFYSFDAYEGNQYIYSYAFVPPGLYILGKNLVNGSSSPSNLYKLLLLIGFIFSLSAMISILLVFTEGGFSSIKRNLPMFWSGNIVSATKMGAFFIFNMCLPGIILVRQIKLKLPAQIFAVVVFVLSVICVLRLGSRTQLAICLITTLAAIIYVLPKRTMRQNTPMLIVLGIVVLLIINNINFDRGADWMATFASRMEDKDNIVSAGGRTQRWEKAIGSLITKPLGWSRKEFGYSHNLWLDVAMIAGLIPFILLTLFSVRSFNQIRKAIKLSPDQLSLNTMFLVYGLAFFLVFMVEPIMIGYFKLFSLFCLFTGLVTAYNVKYSNTSKSD